MKMRQPQNAKLGLLRNLDLFSPSPGRSHAWGISSRHSRRRYPIPVRLRALADAMQIFENVSKTNDGAKLMATGIRLACERLFDFNSCTCKRASASHSFSTKLQLGKKEKKKEFDFHVSLICRISCLGLLVWGDWLLAFRGSLPLPGSTGPSLPDTLCAA